MDREHERGCTVKSMDGYDENQELSNECLICLVYEKR